MTALLLLCLLGSPVASGAEDHPAPAADTSLQQASLYALDGTWTNQSGTKLAWKESAGTTRIVALGYATCKGVCPRIIGDMQRIEKELNAAEKTRCRFTFISLDPANDKVPQLKALGERHKVNLAHWDLLTGDQESVLELAVALGVRFASSTSGQVTGIRFYKAAGNTGTHTGSLFSITGQQLATVTISSAVNLLIVGLLLIGFVIVAPNGIVGLVQDWWRKRSRKSGEAKP